MASSLDASWQSAIRLALRDYPALAAREADAFEHVAAAVAAGALPAHAAELVLAWAVATGDATAAARFEREVAGELAAAARKIDPAPAFVDEVRQAALVRLVVAEPPAAARIAGYRGTGPLRGWAALAALRVALNTRRARRPEAPADVLGELVDREPDPELRTMKSLYRTEFSAALAAALAALPDRQRAVLRLRFVERLELAQIGKLYGVHESTASRWVAAAADAVATDARRRLVAQLSVGASSVDSIARMVASSLDFSIARLLQ